MKKKVLSHLMILSLLMGSTVKAGGGETVMSILGISVLTSVGGIAWGYY